MEHLKWEKKTNKNKGKQPCKTGVYKTGELPSLGLVPVSSAAPRARECW